MRAISVKYGQWTALAVLSLLAFVTPPLVAQDYPAFHLVMSDGRVIPPGDISIKQTLPGGAPDSVIEQSGMRFNIFYVDAPGFGYRDSNLGTLRQIRFEAAVAYIAQVLAAPGTLDVVVQSTTVNNGVLATAGTLFQAINGYQNGTAFLRITSGTKPAASRPEVVVETHFNSAITFFLGSGLPPSNQFDLQSVLSHEMLHAMGFLSLADSTGSSPFQASNPSRVGYTIFDSLLRRNTPNKSLFPIDPGTTFPTFNGTVSDLTSSDVSFGGTQATARFDLIGGIPAGTRPPIFSPNPFQSGSSMSHWRTGSIPGGALMEHAFSPGEIIRQMPPFEAAAMKDLGWNNVDLTKLTKAPVADFTANDTTVGAGVSVQFTDMSAGGSQPCTTFAWNFGDGTTSNVANPTHAYASAGSFTVSLTVTSSIGSDSETKNNFITTSQGPIANFTATPTSGTFPVNVQFTDTSSPNGSTISTRQWNFGDGTSSTETNPAHTYTIEGNFSVSLTVFAPNGTDSETKSSFIVITAPTTTPGGGGGGGGGGSTGGCGGGKSAKDVPSNGDTLISAASIGMLLLTGLRRRK